MAVNRVSGLSSTFDAESLVTQLMKVERTKLTKVQSSKQMTQWEQDAYRSVTDKLNSFKSSFFDVLKADSNVRSSSLFSRFTTTTTINGTASSKVSVKGSANLQNFNQTIESISNLATKDTYKSDDLNIGAIMSGDLSTAFGGTKPATFKATLSVGSNSKTIEVDMSAVTNANEFATALNSEIASEFGANYNTIASVEGNQIKFRSAGNTVTLLAQSDATSIDSMSWLGVESGASSAAYASKDIATLFSLTSGDLSTMTINGKSLESMGVTTTDTVAKMSEKINAAGVGATFSYETLTDKFSIISSKEGSVNSVAMSTDFMDKLKITGGTHAAGEDAVFSLNGVEVIKSENTFTIDGATITLNAEHAVSDGVINVGFKTDTDAIVTKVKSFVEAYNKMIEDVYGMLNEEKDSDYAPLTDEEKEEMTESQITAWENKAKSGVIRNNTTIESFLTRMRQALSDNVEGAGISLADMGIDTSSNYKEYGKLIVKDEQVLKDSINNNYAKVVKLFSSESDKAYLDGANADERYRENGLGNRLYDILQDAVRTTRNSSGKKGILLEMAGIKGDASNATNTLTLKIKDYNDRITTLLDYLDEKEKSYYAKFSAVETAMAQLESQTNSITSMLG